MIEHWIDKDEGIYVDVVSGDPLHGLSRTKVRNKNGDSPYGNGFNDGLTSKGLRYFMKTRHRSDSFRKQNLAILGS